MDSTISAQHSKEFRSRAHRICSEHIGGSWSKITPNQLSLRPVSGGTSNSLFCCSLPGNLKTLDNEPTQVLLRLYGSMWQDCDMSLQIEVFKRLSENDLGPKLFGDFSEGRIEEFLSANPMTFTELANPEISAIIARKLASIHCLDVPLDKTKGWLLDKIKEWITFIQDSGESPLNEQTQREETIRLARELLAIDFREEMKFLRGALIKLKSPIVFSHNDLHQGNILLAEPSKRRPTLEERIVLIDFEYSSYNYRAYDIANHFCEWCFEYDTPEYPHYKFHKDRFPTKEQQRDFVQAYLKRCKQIVAPPPPSTQNGTQTNHHETTNSLDNDTNNNNNDNVAEADEQDDGCDPSCKKSKTDDGRHHVPAAPNNRANISTNSDEEDALMTEIKPFLMAANFFWTVWCIKCALTSTLRFGYWEHAMERWRLYTGFKASYLKGNRKLSQSNLFHNHHLLHLQGARIKRV